MEQDAMVALAPALGVARRLQHLNVSGTRCRLVLGLGFRAEGLGFSLG